jgi:hypothetical protein
VSKRIVLVDARFFGGVESAAGETVTVSDELADDLVYQGLASFADTQPAVSDAVDLSEQGVNPDASPSFNLQRINAALRRGGRVELRGPAGDYYINDTLIVRSKTRLSIAPGVVIKQADGINKLMFTNYANTQLAADVHDVVTIAWTAGAVATVTHASHGKTTSDYVLIQGAEASGAVTAATRANPGVITSTAHGLQTGWVIRFRNVGGMTQLNYVSATSNAYRVVRINADTLSLETDAGAVDTSAFGVFTSGGEWVLELPEYNHCLRVHKVVDANSYKVVLPDNPRRQPSGGTIKAFDVDTDIHIDGLTLDYNKANNDAGGQGTQRHACVLGAIARSSVENFEARDVEKYGLNTMGDADCSYENIRGYRVAEIFKHYGPSNHHVVDGIYGSAIDDCSTVQPKEPNSFVAYQAAWGDVRGMRISNVHCETDDEGASSASVVVYASEFETADVSLTNLNVHSDTGNGFQLKNGDTYSVGKLGRITVDGLRCSSDTATTKYAFNISCNVDFLQVENASIQPQDNATSFFRQESQSTIRTFIWRGLRVDSREWPAGTSVYMLNLNGAGGTFVLEDATISLDTTYGRLITLGTGVWSSLAFRRVTMDSGAMFGIVQASATTVRNITMEQCNIKNVASGWDVRSLTNFVLNQNRFDTMTQGVIRPTTTAGLMARVYGMGNTFTSAAPIAASGSATFEVYSWDIAIDPATITGIATTLGQYCTSTQAGNESGPCVRGNANGTPGWYAIAGGASGANAAIT